MIIVIVGSVKKLYIAPVGTSGVRVQKESIELVEGAGIVDDKFYSAKPHRVVMGVGEDAYRLAREHNIELPETALGENLLFDFDPHSFAPGTKFEIGDAILEITEACTLCSHLVKYDKRLPKLILNKRGQYFRVLKSGVVKAGDSVKLISNNTTYNSKLI